jgi:hypothetical protein
MHMLAIFSPFFHVLFSYYLILPSGIRGEEEDAGLSGRC